MAATIIASRFEDVCGVCLGVIAVGDRIAWERGRPARHADCAPVRYALVGGWMAFTVPGRHYHASAAERSAILRAVRDAENTAGWSRPDGAMVARCVRDVDEAWTYEGAARARIAMEHGTERRTLDGVRERALATIR